jgi:hypothetical protein
MQINKAKLAAGDHGEVLKLVRSIKASEPRDRNANPMTSQFFDPDPSNVRPLSTSELVTSLAGQPFNERVKEIEDLGENQHQGDGTLEAFGIKFNGPKPAGDVTQIGARPRSGWTPPVTVASGAKAVLNTKLQKALAALSPSQRAALEKADPSTDSDSILTETLKSIVAQLLGASLDNFDASTLKVRIAKAVKSRPDLGKRLQKALGRKEPNVDLDLDALIAAGAKVTKNGSVLHISV